MIPPDPDIKPSHCERVKPAVINGLEFTSRASSFRYAAITILPSCLSTVYREARETRISLERGEMTV